MLLIASVVGGYHEYKMFGLKDLVNFASASASGDGKIVIFAPLFAPLMHVENCYPEVKSFTKNGGKFCW